MVAIEQPRKDIGADHPARMTKVKACRHKRPVSGPLVQQNAAIHMIVEPSRSKVSSSVPRSVLTFVGMRWIVSLSLLLVATALRGNEQMIKVYFRGKSHAAFEGRDDPSGCTDQEISLLRRELVSSLSSAAGSCSGYSLTGESVCFHASPSLISEYRRLRAMQHSEVNLEVPAFSRRQMSTFDMCRDGVHTVRMAVVEVVALAPVSAQCVIGFQEAAEYNCA